MSRGPVVPFSLDDHHNRLTDSVRLFLDQVRDVIRIFAGETSEWLSTAVEDDSLEDPVVIPKVPLHEVQPLPQTTTFLRFSDVLFSAIVLLTVDDLHAAKLSADHLIDLEHPVNIRELEIFQSRTGQRRLKGLPPPWPPLPFMSCDSIIICIIGAMAPMAFWPP